MNKDTIISVLAGVIAAQNACGVTGQEQIGIFIGTATTVFIFLLFLDDLHDRWCRYKRRIRDMRIRVARLRNLKIGEDHGPDRR